MGDKNGASANEVITWGAWNQTTKICCMIRNWKVVLVWYLTIRVHKTRWKPETFSWNGTHHLKWIPHKSNNEKYNSYTPAPASSILELRMGKFSFFLFLFFYLMIVYGNITIINATNTRDLTFLFRAHLCSTDNVVLFIEAPGLKQNRFVNQHWTDPNSKKLLVVYVCLEKPQMCSII